jgi:hypothetical protein
MKIITLAPETNNYRVSLEPPNLKTKVFIGSGNNDYLIRRVLKKRPWFKEVDKPIGRVDFTWQQSSKGLPFDKLTSKECRMTVNHYEFHREISTKINLIRNLQHYCEVS